MVGEEVGLEFRIGVFYKKDLILVLISNLGIKIPVLKSGIKIFNQYISQLNDTLPHQGSIDQQWEIFKNLSICNFLYN